MYAFLFYTCTDVESFHVSSLPHQFKKSRDWKKLEANLDGLFNMIPHIDGSDSNQTYPTSALRQVR